MPHRPIGNHVMTPAERQQRRRDKLKALRNAPPAADPVLAFLSQRPAAVAEGIYRRVPELTPDIDLALRRLLWQNRCRSEWQPLTRATSRTNNAWMRW